MHDYVMCFLNQVEKGTPDLRAYAISACIFPDLVITIEVK